MFSWELNKKKFFLKKNFKMADSKNNVIQNRQFSNFGLILGLVELIDAKDIGVAKLMWS